MFELASFMFNLKTGVFLHGHKSLEYAILEVTFMAFMIKMVCT